MGLFVARCLKPYTNRPPATVRRHHVMTLDTIDSDRLERGG